MGKKILTEQRDVPMSARESLLLSHAWSYRLFLKFRKSQMARISGTLERGLEVQEIVAHPCFLLFLELLMIGCV